MEILTIDPLSGELPDLWCFPEPYPNQLHVRGSRSARTLLERLPERGLAVVGTRDPRATSLAEVDRIIASLRGTGLTIVSGLALGIDAAAHEAALNHGLPTIAVLASGLDRIHPVSHVSLAERILRSGGLILSEYESGEPAYPGRFLERNRLIAGLAKATWIVEASRRSGSLNTARWTRDLHREVYATPCRPQDPTMAGNQALLDQHHAIALWQSYSLGQTWGELSARADQSPPLFPSKALGSFRPHRSGTRFHSRSPTRKSPPILREDARTLVNSAREPEGIHLLHLLERQLIAGWSPGRYHLALHEALQAGALVERNGLLLNICDDSL